MENEIRKVNRYAFGEKLLVLTSDQGKIFEVKHSFGSSGESAQSRAYRYLLEPYIPAPVGIGNILIFEKHNIVKVGIVD